MMAPMTKGALLDDIVGFGETGVNVAQQWGWHVS